MPSFYNHHMPLTPPEYSTGFPNPTCAGLPYRPHGYGAQQYGRSDDMSYEYTGRYPQTQQVHPQATAAIHQQPVFSSTVSMPATHRYNEPVGLPLPPVRSLDQSLLNDRYQRPPEYRQYEQQQSHQKTKDEKPVGGVSAKLDYDMEWMTDFVAEMAQQIVQPGRPAYSGFRTWVNGVLCATRLPSATIVLSLHYLSIRTQMLQAEGLADGHSDNFIYRLLTVSLIMGSKFLDDNTFINRSWADVSGIDIKTLNHMEMEWLAAIKWNLHLDPATPQGFNTWMQHWRDYENRALSRGAQSLKLSPLDTNVQRHQPAHVHKSFSPPSAVSTFTPMSAVEYSARSYHTPAYAQYDPWLVRRSGNDGSPNSAPHTGPTTPEYYGGPGTWAPLDGGAYSYSRRAYGFNQMPQPQHIAQPQAAPYTPFTPTYNQQNAYTGHSIHCGCGHCSRQHMPYWGSHFNQQPVVA